MTLTDEQEIMEILIKYVRNKSEVIFHILRSSTKEDSMPVSRIDAALNEIEELKTGLSSLKKKLENAI